MRHSLLALCVLSALAAPAYAATKPATTEQRIEALEARIQELEAEVQALKGQPAQAAQAAVPATTTPGAPATAPAESDLEALAASPQEQANAQAAAPVAPATPADTTAALAAPEGTGGSNANAFNPAISVILNGSYSHHSLNPDDYVRAGFPVVAGAGPSANGFSLGESEMSLAANIDDKFYGQLTLTAESENGQDHIGVEEAFVDTTALPAGFSLRMGRFYSNIGYLNSHHAHTDNFFDRPLAYQAFLGNQYGDDGAQLRWVAPTSLFVELGGELFRGDNYPSGGAQNG